MATKDESKKEEHPNSISPKERKKRINILRYKFDIRPPLKPFFLFCKIYRDTLIKKNINEIMTQKELSQIWRKLSEKEKNHFKELYTKKYKEFENKIISLPKEIVDKEESEDELTEIEDSFKSNISINNKNFSDEDDETTKDGNDKNIKYVKDPKKNAKTNKKDFIKSIYKACNCGICDECYKYKKIRYFDLEKDSDSSYEP